MKKLLGLLFHPLLVALVALAALGLVVWYVGPLLAVGSWRPLESEAARWAVIGATVLIWAGSKLFGWLRMRRRNSQLMGGLVAAARPPQPAVPTASQAEVAALDERFRQAVAALREVRLAAAGRRPGIGDLISLSGRQYLYQLPWYVFIGAPGSGKTTALINSGLSFPLAERFGTASIKGVGGTRNCDWWFTDEAVLLDTAGRYTTQESNREVDADAWQGFLRLLKQARPRQPINGVILTVSVADLLQQRADEQEAHAAAVRARLHELQEQFRIRLPIYVLVTKADLIAGFTDFFENLGKEERAQVWGVTFARQDDAGQPPLAGFAAEMDALHGRLLDRVLERMQALRDLGARARVHAFPQQFAELTPLLGSFLERVFAASKYEESALLRGVYFTSGTQEGSPIDRVLGTLARSLGLERKLVPPTAASGRSYFINALLRQVVFAEQGLAGSNLALERRRNLLRWGAWALAGALLAAAAAIWLVSYARNKAYVEDVQQRVAALREQVQALPAASMRSTDVVGLLPLLRSVRNLATTNATGGSRPWSMTSGLFQGDKLAAASEQAYRELLRDALLPRLAQRIEDQLRNASAGNLEFAYETLKAYLMLHDPAHFNADALKAWIAVDWERTLPRDLSVEQRAELERHLATLLEREALTTPLPADPRLVASVRSMLARYPFANRVYSRLRRQGVGAQTPEFTIARAAGPAAPLVFVRASGEPLTKGMPGLYTFDGYHNAFSKAAETLTAQLAAEEDWVLGLPADKAAARNPAQLADDVRRLYLNDYADRWEKFIADIKLVRPSNLTQSIEITRVLSAPDTPLVPLMKALSRETTLAQKPEGEKSVADKTVDKIKDTKAELKRIFGTAAPGADVARTAPLESIVDDRFENLRRQVTPVAGQPAPVDATVALLNEIYTALSATETAIKSNVAPPPSDVRRKVEPVAARLPEPLRTVLQAIASAASAQIAGESRRTLSKDVGAAVGEFCQKAITGRYPFVRSSTLDVPMQDFERLFAPGGQIDSFFQKNLAERVDTSTRPWSFRKINDTSFGDPGNLAQFQRAQTIRDVFFRSGGTQAALRLEFRPLSMDAAVNQFILDVDGQLVKYSHGPQVPQTVQWPGPRGSMQVRLQMQPPGPGGVSGDTTSGPWALFRMFDRVRMEATSVPERFRATFKVDGREAEFEIVASSVQNPFRLRELEQFQCPMHL